MIKWMLAFGLHAVWAAAFLYLYNASGTANPDLDAMALSLSIFQTVIAVLALAGFGYVAVVAEKTAGKTARDTAQNLVSSELPAMVKREMKELRELSSVLGPPTTGDTSQSTADSLDQEKNHDPIR